MSIGVEIDGLTKRYRQGHADAAVIDNLCLELAGGEFVSIMGPSGSGKSTLLNLIAGLDTPDAGRILVGGQDIARMTDDQRSDLRLRRMGFVFQSFNLLPTFTVEENVLWPLELLGRSEREARALAREALDHVGLPSSVFARLPTELSGGEQQRAAIARALATGPDLLLADEPTGNLDSRTGQTVLDLIRRLNRERHLTIVLVTHSAYAATFGDRTIELRDGKPIRDVRRPVEPARVIPIHE
jgi:putative ABC transport system ATP-binding protein